MPFLRGEDVDAILDDLFDADEAGCSGRTDESPTAARASLTKATTQQLRNQLRHLQSDFDKKCL